MRFHNLPYPEVIGMAVTKPKRSAETKCQGRFSRKRLKNVLFICLLGVFPSQKVITIASILPSLEADVIKIQFIEILFLAASLAMAIL